MKLLNLNIFYLGMENVNLQKSFCCLVSQICVAVLCYLLTSVVYVSEHKT